MPPTSKDALPVPAVLLSDVELRLAALVLAGVICECLMSRDLPPVHAYVRLLDVLYDTQAATVMEWSRRLDKGQK